MPALTVGTPLIYWNAASASGIVGMLATAVLQQGGQEEAEPIATDALDDAAIAAIGVMSSKPSAAMIAVAVAKTLACSLAELCDGIPATS